MIADLMAAGIGTLTAGVPHLRVSDLFCGAGGGTDATREAAERCSQTMALPEVCQ